MTASVEAIEPGDIRTRAQIRAVFGGSPQGGICPSNHDVNIYSDPAVGEKSGYYDGWLAEDQDDLFGPVYEYTGAGRKGDQTFDGHSGTGNRAILQHAKRGRTLRVFTRDGKVPGSDTKTHRYLGAFTLDPVTPYVWRRAPGEDGQERNVVVFRLRPEGRYQHEDQDQIPPASETTAELVPFQPVTADSLETDAATTVESPLPTRRTRNRGPGRGAPPNRETSGTLGATESHTTKLSVRAAAGATVAVRREAELTQDYKARLDAAGHQTGAFQIKVKGLTSTLRTDLYDATDHVLFEVKGSNSREDVRMGLGQLLDYSRYVTSPDHPGQPRRILVLPDAPPADMHHLLDQYDVGLVYRAGDGTFVGETTV